MSGFGDWMHLSDLKKGSFSLLVETLKRDKETLLVVLVLGLCDTERQHEEDGLITIFAESITR